MVWPESAEEISAVLSYANRHRVPGTSLEGNPIPVCGGIVLDMLQMEAIMAIRAADFQVDVQAGMKRT